MANCTAWTSNPYCTKKRGTKYQADGKLRVAVGWDACKLQCSGQEDFGDTNTETATADLVTAQAIDTFGSMMTVYVIIFAIIAIAMYVIIFMAASKTSNEGLKIFLIVSMFLPFFAPISFIMAIMILANVM